MNYKNAFQLAEAKGYKQDFTISLDGSFHDNAEMHRYIDLCLIQKWLRDEHKIDVCINPHYMVGGGVAGYLADVYHQYEIGQKGFSQNGYTYEEALLQGIHEALKLL